MFCDYLTLASRRGKHDIAFRAPEIESEICVATGLALAREAADFCLTIRSIPGMFQGADRYSSGFPLFIYVTLS